MRLWLDLETACDVPIRRGTYAYAASARIILYAWAVDDGPIQVEEQPSVDLIFKLSEADEIWAHNAQFDRVVLDRFHGYSGDLNRWRCTAALARMHGLPGGLGKLCEILKIDHADAKDAGGKDLIRLFCMPNKDGYSDKLLRPVEWEQFKRYAALDVAAMRACHAKLPQWNAAWHKWHLNQRINDRGVATDRDLARAIVKQTTEARRKLDADTALLTDFESTSQVARVRAYCAEHGVQLADLTKDTVERRLEDESLPQHIKWLLTARQEVSKSSTAKARRLLECVCPDGKLRGTMTFCGASRTGRISGNLFQPLNLPRPKHEQPDIDAAIEMALMGELELYDQEHVMGYSADMLRGLLVASPGHKLLSADWVAIEGRDTCWFAGEQWELDAYALNDAGKGPKPYAVNYAKAFNIDPADVKKGTLQYLIGKVMSLALGYQGAVGALAAMSETYGLRIPELAAAALPTLSRQILQEADVAWAAARSYYTLGPVEWKVLWCLVQLWRRSHPRICAFWYELEDAVRACLRHGRDVQCGRLVVSKQAAWLLIRLPSGRCLGFPGMREELDGGLTFWGVHPYTRQWMRISTYGGKMTENVAQAIAVDLHDEALQEAEDAGLCPVLSVYDEINCDSTPDRALAELSACMLRPRAWAEGLPLAIEGWEGPRYHK